MTLDSRGCCRVLSLEAEVATIPPLKKQVDEYKRRVTSFELEVRDLKKELEKRSKVAASMEAHASTLSMETEVTQQRARALEHELEANAALGAAAPVAGAGLSDLSPELVEKVARLEKDNVALKSKLDATSESALSALEDAVDDAKRLSTSFEVCDGFTSIDNAPFLFAQHVERGCCATEKAGCHGGSA